MIGGTPSVTLHNYATAAGPVNITPLTDLAVAKALSPIAPVRFAWVEITLRTSVRFLKLLHRGLIGGTLAKREEVMDEWHRTLMHQAVPALIGKWETKLGVKVSGYFI